MTRAVAAQRDKGKAGEAVELASSLQPVPGVAAGAVSHPMRLVRPLIAPVARVAARHRGLVLHLVDVHARSREVRQAAGVVGVEVGEDHVRHVGRGVAERGDLADGRLVRVELRPGEEGLEHLPPELRAQRLAATDARPHVPEPAHVLEAESSVHQHESAVGLDQEPVADHAAAPVRRPVAVHTAPAERPERAEVEVGDLHRPGKLARSSGGSTPERRYNARALRAAPIRPRRARVATLTSATGAALTAALIAAPSALAGVIAPESGGGSPNASHIKTLYLIAFVLGILIFLLVEGVLIYSLVKFRWRRGGEPPAQIRGNTKLEIGWTIGAASILVILVVVTFIFLGPIKNPAGSKAGGYVAELQQSGGGGAPGRPGPQVAALGQRHPPGPASTHLNIHVNGQQYLWRYDYPGQAQVFSYTDMYVPTNTTVTLDITASDVDHSWWIPKLGGKADAIPGHVNHTWFRISEPGVYMGQCAELCGEGHADMIGRVIAVSPAQYRAWLARQAGYVKESQALLALERRTRGANGP